MDNKKKENIINKNIFPVMEEEILSFWEKNKVFEKSLEKGKKDYVFYDGPPFATGTPHYGHIVASTMKDIVPRYWTMKGYRVERKWGWDCHGLPIENIVEKEMGSKSKKYIENMGVAEFNEKCRSKVLGYVDEWEKVIRRLGRWADMKNAYKTMDLSYMESVWYVFKELWDKGLIYEDYRVIHICTRCETTLSQSEVSEGYKLIKDLSVVSKFPITDKSFLEKYCDDLPTNFLAWTTTPWSLPTTMGLALGAKYNYLVAKIGEEQFIFAKDRLDFVLNYKKDLASKVIRELKGESMVGVKYTHVFEDNYKNNEKVKNNPNVYKTHLTDYVSTEEGTGIVTINGAFGDIDMQASKIIGLPIVVNVKMDGSFFEEMGEFAGMNVKPIDDNQKTDVEIIKYLAKKNLLFAKEKYEHSYPHCWRCETPLINYATTSWFVAVMKVKARALELAKKINWSPEHIKEGRFGNWLKGARDWSISRQRFWASVMPIWRCECGEVKVFGSVDELEKVSGEKITDLHKHFVDKITFKCEKCSGVMKRVPDVLDTWFDSGSMPYAQMHYPFENKEKFEKNFPAEFIAEGDDQTRAWFYYLHVLGTAVKDSPAFKNVIVNGIVLAEDGKKMSKRLNNYPDPMKVMDKYGADPLRYYLCASPVMRADNINFSEKDLGEQTRFLNVLFNVLSFYKMFAQEEEIADLEKKDLVNVLDKWIISRLEQTKDSITEKMDNYNLQAIREIPIFINDLSTWYIRRSRDRFKGDDRDDKMRALKTLRRTLYHLARVMAPFMPFMAEHIYQELGAKNAESVHLETWPEVKKEWIDKKVLTEMETVRKIVELGLAERDKAGIKVRQMLNQLKITNCELGIEYKNLIADELNVKNVISEKGEGELKVELDTVLTDDLKQEGLKREIVRLVNNLRKQAGLTIKDKIILSWQGDSELVKKVFSEMEEELKRDVLCDEIIEKNIESSEVIIANDEKLKLNIEKI